MAYFGQNRRIQDLEVFDDGTLAEIQHFASRGLSKEEILDGYSAVWDDLPAADKKAFDEHYKYGKVQGLKAMSDALFMQANTKGGTPAALAYLLRFGANFPNISESGGGSATITIRDETGANIIPDSSVKIS